MKPNSPSLLVYITTCCFIVALKLMGLDNYALYLKTCIVPVVFIYYFITNDYKISLIKSIIFLLCFSGDVFNLIQFDYSPVGAFYCFLLVRILLLKSSIDDFKSLKYIDSDRFPIFISILVVFFICISVLCLQFENLVLDFSYYITYSMVLSLLVAVSVVNYLKKPSYVYLNLVVMSVLTTFSDVFYLLNKFYISLFVFSFFAIVLHVFSYFFLVHYFIANNNYSHKHNQDHF